MTKEEAIRILEENNPFMGGRNYERISEAFDMAIEALENNDKLAAEVKALKQTDWIPVSEKLPEDDDCYLVTTSGTNNDIIDIAYYTTGIWHKASRIKAWMPLPEPYKESEES